MARSRRIEKERAGEKRHMKLGCCYQIFDGQELLEASISSVRNQVDYICVVYQIVSNFGERCADDLVSILKSLEQRGLVDELVLYTPKIFGREERIPLISVRATGVDLQTDSIESIGNQFFNEISKRELGRRLCERNECTHFMSLDADEFFEEKQLAFAKKKMWTNDWEGALCLMQYYYKDPTIRLVPADNLNHVSCIFKIAHHLPFRLAAPYPFVVDPTRRLENLRRLHVFPREELEMHHFSFVRRDIRTKLRNVSNRNSYDGTAEIRRFVAAFQNWKHGDPLVHPHPYFRKHFKGSERVGDPFGIGKRLQASPNRTGNAGDME